MQLMSYRAVAASVVMAAYGHKVTSNDDPYIHLVEKASRMTAASGSPGATPVDFFPACRSSLILSHNFFEFSALQYGIYHHGCLVPVSSDTHSLLVKLCARCWISHTNWLSKEWFDI